MSTSKPTNVSAGAPATNHAVEEARSTGVVEFDHALPKKPFLRPREVADALSLSESMIERLSDTGQLYGHRYNAGTGRRAARRILRDSVLVLLLRTRDYDRSDHVRAIESLLRGLSETELASVKAKLLEIELRVRRGGGAARLLASRELSVPCT